MTDIVESAYPDETFFGKSLDDAVTRAREALLALQNPDGYWCFELEADCTIPAEYVLMMHYMDEIDENVQTGVAVYLRDHQADHGGWPLYYRGDFDLSCSVKAYYALKLAGDEPDAPHMKRAREAILSHGGAARSNVFTRYTMALFGQIPWRGVPFTPVEAMLFPGWFPFHANKVAYWTRTVAIPLAILRSLKAKAKNPRGIEIRELFTKPPEKEKYRFPVRSLLNYFFVVSDRIGHFFEPCIPRFVRKYAVRKAEAWFIERLNGTDGLGAIFPAMVNAYEALALLGYPADHPYRIAARDALRKLLVTHEGWTYCQPCVSPVWDTAFCCYALQEEGSEEAKVPSLRGLDWLKDRQVLDRPGDWRVNHPNLRGGGWAFQFSNPHYPDLDDTSMVARAMHRSGHERFREPVKRAVEWVRGMQSKNGGFAAFDSDNTHFYLNEIPFADSEALLDPPTADVSARCASLLIETGCRDEVLERCLDYLRKEQEEDGSWFGRWGTNYIYGTGSALIALRGGGDAPELPHIRRAVQWFKDRQRDDRGWGEDCDTYFYPDRAGRGYASTPFQTAWAMIALLAAGEGDSPEMRRGAEYLLRTQEPTGLWSSDWFSAPGFPRVFYLKYHGYPRYFPLLVLARYRNIRSRA